MMSHYMLVSLAVAFLSILRAEGLSLQTQGDQDEHGISLHHQFDDEVEDAFISLISHDVALSKPVPSAERAEIRHRRYLEMMGTLLWVVGICLGLLGQSVVALGYLIQKMGQNEVASEDMAAGPASDAPGVLQKSSSSAMLEDVGGGYFTNRIWWLGFIVFVCGHLFCWAALGFAPQPVLACLQSWNMVVVMLLGPRMVNERIPDGACGYCSLIIIGCIIVVSCGPQGDGSEAVNFQALEVDMYQWYWIFPVAGTMLLMILAHAANVEPAYVFIFLSACCAWYAATLAKITAVVAAYDVFYSGDVGLGLFLMFIVFLTLAMFQIHFMNMAMRHGDATLVIPMYEVLSMIGNIIFGAIFWHDFQGIGVPRFTGFVFGVTIIVCGLSMLTHAKKRLESASPTPVQSSRSKLDVDSAIQGA